MSATLGERIREARVLKGLSIGQLASRIGVTEDALRKIEAGSTQQPAFIVGVRIAIELGINPDYLALGDDSLRREVESRPVAAALEELERLLMQISAISRLASNLEGQARDALRRIARG